MNKTIEVAAESRGLRIETLHKSEHTHWVGSCQVSSSEHQIFDVNCLCVGGWVSVEEWSGRVVPWLLREAEPKANGGWHLTHAIEIAYEVEDHA